MRFQHFIKRFLAASLALSASALASDSLSDRIGSLAPTIGVHPPNINSQAEFDSIKVRYEELKSEVDKLIETSPKNQGHLLERGRLQSMGHNIDYPGAWQGSTDDFKAILGENPAHIEALTGLGSLWVNSEQRLAPKAEELFRAAQCFTGKEPLEDAQRGLFFAFYYQGKMQEAYYQSEFLVKTWPMNQDYQRLNETTREVLARSADGGGPLFAQLAMQSCKP